MSNLHPLFEQALEPWGADPLTPEDLRYYTVLGTSFHDGATWYRIKLEDGRVREIREEELPND